MVIAQPLLSLGISDRKIYLYDTFAGMSEPTEHDHKVSSVAPARDKWEEGKTDQGNLWCYSSIDEVKRNLALTGYPSEHLVFVKGKVEESIPNTIPSQFCLLRLDTDWYESTRHELVHLFPLLSDRGVLIIDDYGTWAGSKKAVDEYFADKKILFNRIDSTGFIGTK
jgi:hypothetical protein